jgi:hypothetical protein
MPTARSAITLESQATCTPPDPWTRCHWPLDTHGAKISALAGAHAERAPAREKAAAEPRMHMIDPRVW